MQSRLPERLVFGGKRKPTPTPGQFQVRCAIGTPLMKPGLSQDAIEHLGKSIYIDGDRELPKISNELSTLLDTYLLPAFRNHQRIDNLKLPDSGNKGV